jgi:tRNA-specific 2-thiouridylase
VVDCSWVVVPEATTACAAQLRAHGRPLPATVDGMCGAAITLRLDHPAEQVSPGQAAVLYAGDEVLGGGVIAAAA